MKFLCRPSSFLLIEWQKQKRHHHLVKSPGVPHRRHGRRYVAGGPSQHPAYQWGIASLWYPLEGGRRRPTISPPSSFNWESFWFLIAAFPLLPSTPVHYRVEVVDGPGLYIRGENIFPVKNRKSQWNGKEAKFNSSLKSISDFIPSWCRGGPPKIISSRGGGRCYFPPHPPRGRQKAIEIHFRLCP